MSKPVHMNPYLLRTLELAARGGTAVAPNPQVGAVLEADNNIVAEGWHAQYGGPHAEVAALAQVADAELLKKATLYVGLEPCNHHGKTPPCVDLILTKGISKVVVGSTDPNPKASGGIARLRAAGVTVEVNNNQNPFICLNRHFWVNQVLHRPYITLKWAETADGKLGDSQTRLHISSGEGLAFGHSLRAQHQAVLVGRKTALQDDPSLTTRYYPGANPIRLILDKALSLPPHLQVLTDGHPTWVLNNLQDEKRNHVSYVLLQEMNVLSDLRVLLYELYTRLNVGSILVEGGAITLQSFIDAQLFDELYVIRSDSKAPLADVQAPRLPTGVNLKPITQAGSDWILATFAPRISQFNTIYT